MSFSEPAGGASGKDPRLLRVSHADRERVVGILRDAAGEGRLDADELDERLEAALNARTFADLEPLTEDLPVGPLVPPAAGPGSPGLAAMPPAGEGGGPEDAVVSVSASAPVPVPGGEVPTLDERGIPMRREGAWLVPPVMNVNVHGGQLRLDYTVARLPEGGASLLRVRVHGGVLRVTVPPGMVVDASGVRRFGGAVRDRASAFAGPGLPVTHVITLRGEVHGGKIEIVASRVHRGRSERRERIHERRAERRSRRFGDGGFR